MSTAVAVYTSEGCVGRCDAKRHEATEPECDCICGGRLHGKGSSAAAIVQNTEDFLGHEAVEAWAREHGYGDAAGLYAVIQPALEL